MLEQLKKKKALESLSRGNQAGRALSKQFSEELHEGSELKNEYKKEMGDVTENPPGSALIEKPMYEELNKVPKLEQLEMIKKQIDANKEEEKQDPSVGTPESEEEKKKRLMLKMLGGKLV